MKNWAIKTRVIVSFAGVLAILLGASAMAVVNFTRVISAIGLSEQNTRMNRFVLEREVDHLNWVKGLSVDLLGAGKFSGQLDPSKCQLGKWLSNSEEQARIVDVDIRRLIAQIDKSHRALHGSAGRIFDAKRNGNVEEASELFSRVTLPALTETSGYLNQIRDRLDVAATKSSQILQREVQSGRTEQLVFGCVALLMALVVGFLLTRYLSGRLRQAVADLTDGARQMASAAGQLSSSSQSLAQGASEQASSLEETSASSQEVNSMARRNTENSHQAAGLVSRYQQKLMESNQKLDQMVVAMDEINAQSRKISKIIKVIDEIAFQTNILALNAAVEAARAGDAGMGFAVVANEVRNLAQRCGQAARDTASLIEESLRKSNDGKVKVDQATGAIRAITDEGAKVKALVDDVNLGSQEQARGIEQIAKAITQMEQVTQRTAASSEESAAAAEELTAQSETLRSVVESLAAMVDGGLSVHREAQFVFTGQNRSHGKL